MGKERITIIRSKEQSGDEEQLSIFGKGDKELKKMATATLIAHATIGNLQKALNYGISNIGNFTGDYTKTENIQEIIGVVSDFATVGIGFATNPIAGAIALAGVAMNRGLEAVSYFQDQRHKDIETEYLRERSGNSTMNGSRGTEN